MDAAFSRPGSADWLRDLDSRGLLDRVLPELVPMKGCTQPKEHYWDVFDHSIETLAALDRIVETLPAIAAGERATSGLKAAGAAWLLAALEGESLRLTRLAALLHDVAKPATKQLQADGRTRFFGHPELGAAMSREILGRFGYPADERAFVAGLIDLHLRPGQLGDFPPTQRAVRKLARDAGPGIGGLLVLNLADHAAARGPRLTTEGWNVHLTYVDEVIRQVTAEPPEKLPRLVTGHDLMERLGLPPGPRLGRLLNAIAAAQQAGRLQDRAEALALAESLLSTTL